MIIARQNCYCPMCICTSVRKKSDFGGHFISNFFHARRVSVERDENQPPPVPDRVKKIEWTYNLESHANNLYNCPNYSRNLDVLHNTEKILTSTKKLYES